MPALEQLFSHVCGQEHVWTLGGKTLPFCQRCTGLYVGGLIALGVYVFSPPCPTPRVTWIHGWLLLLMVPFGYHWVPQNGAIRMLTGQFFAFGLVYCLAPNLATCLPLWQQREPWQARGYGFAALVAILFLQFAVHWGGTFTAAILSWMGVAGMAVYALLVVANAVVLPASLWSMVRRRIASSAP